MHMSLESDLLHMGERARAAAQRLQATKETHAESYLRFACLVPALRISKGCSGSRGDSSTS